MIKDIPYDKTILSTNNSLYIEQIIVKNKIRCLLKDKSINKIINKFFYGEISRDALIYYLSKAFRLEYNHCKELGDYLSSLIKKEKNKVKENELVSIIITTYNRKQFLTDAIKSILNQTYKNIEIIVVDDCSDDGTEELFDTIFTDDNIFYYKNKENRGCGFSRRYAFDNYCKGKYIIFMDDDDFYIDNDYINKSILIHESIDDLAFVSADTFIEYPDKMILNELNNYGSVSGYEYFINFMKYDYKKPSSTFTAVFKKEVLEKVKLSEMKMVNDTSIYLRALLHGNPYFLNDVVGVYRIHGNNITYSCSVQFIIDNLEEKYKIGILAKERFNLDDEQFENWLFEQFYITIIYYLENSPSNIKDKLQLLRWIKGKSSYSYKKFRNIIIRRYLK